MVPDSNDARNETVIAVIGLAGRFPKAPNVDQFWENLCNGVETVQFLSPAEISAAGQAKAAELPNYVNAASLLEDVELFDAAFFGYTPREAEIMDPQQRFFLECSWTALEAAGYETDSYRGAIGVFGGVSMNTYVLQLFTQPDLLKKVNRFQIAMGNDKDHLPTRVSYKLNLKGPSMAVQSTCSTSLVAVHLACQSLLNGECDMALAGGVSIRLPQKSGYFYQEGNINSPDGHCRAFDARAQGTISGSGVGVVVLKRLADAVADGDVIQAVIKGSAVNNDGSLKVGYTAPSVEGQAAVIAEALSVADVSADSVTYVEAHGTGTALGDPIEVAALTSAFRLTTSRNGYCALASVKSNLGHLDAAAGVAGFIKAVLALKHRRIPASLHFEQPNPKIDFANSPFYVNAQLQEWVANGAPRRAGVSSFGIGGTNAHVVLEEAPERSATADALPWQLFVLSAKTATALDAATANLLLHLEQNPDQNLADTAYTLQVGRRAFDHRRMFVSSSRGDTLGVLQSKDARRLFSNKKTGSTPYVVFMFSGQGAQYVNMGLDLYREEPTFRANIDRCAEVLSSRTGLDVRQLLYPPDNEVETAHEQLNQTRSTQPALFVLEYALAHLWLAWGVRPSAMIGHSIGELVAACLSGVMSLEDALTLVTDRAELMQQLPGGVMLAVPLEEEIIAAGLADYQLSLASVNAPSQSVVAGTEGAIAAFEKRLSAEGVSSRRLVTSHAFHSAMMEPAISPFVARVGQVKLNPPQIPYVSNVTGEWITAAEATDPNYWGRHLRETVRFAAGLAQFSKEQNRILLEVGPGHALSALGRRNHANTSVTISSLPHHTCDESDFESLLKSAGQLWLAGASLDWKALHGDRRRQRVTLPTYPFERQKFWIGRSEMEADRTPTNETIPVVVAAPEEVRGEARPVESGASAMNKPAPPPAASDVALFQTNLPAASTVTSHPADQAPSRRSNGEAAPQSVVRQRIIAQQLRLMTQQLEVLRRKQVT